MPVAYLRSQKLEADIATARHNLAALEATTSRALAERRDLTKDQEEIRLSIEDLQSSEAESKTRRKALNQELAQVRQRLKDSKKRLDETLPALEAKAQQERDLRSALDTTTARLEALYAKQGRSDKFKSKNERDAYLRTEIQTAEELLAAQEERVEAVAREVKETADSLERLTDEQNEVDAQLDQGRKANAGALKQRQTLRSKLETLDEQRKALWREDGKLSSTVANAKQAKQEAERALSGVMDKVSTVARVRRERRLTIERHRTPRTALRLSSAWWPSTAFRALRALCTSSLPSMTDTRPRWRRPLETGECGYSAAHTTADLGAQPLPRRCRQ